MTGLSFATAGGGWWLGLILHDTRSIAAADDWYDARCKLTPPILVVGVDDDAFDRTEDG